MAIVDRSHSGGQQSPGSGQPSPSAHSQSQIHVQSPSHQSHSNLEAAAKAYLENNVRYYLQNRVNKTSAESKTSSSANRNAAKDFIVKATKLSKTSAATNAQTNRQTAPAVATAAPMSTPTQTQLTTHSGPHITAPPVLASTRTLTAPTREQTLAGSRVTRQEQPFGKFAARIHRSRIMYSGPRHKMRRMQHNFAHRFNDHSRRDVESVNASESESGLNWNTSSSVDTVIFCGKSNINRTNRTDLGSKSKLKHNVSTNTGLNSTPVQTNAQKDNSKDEMRRNDGSKNCNETPVPSPNHRSNKESKKSDELWIDRPKRSRRKKDHKSLKWSQELWVDGPNAQLEPNVLESEHSMCYHEEKQQRIQQWIQQHTKHIWSDFPTDQSIQTPDTSHKQSRQKTLLPEVSDASCQTDVTPSTVTNNSSEGEMSFSDALKILSNEEIFGIERIAGAGREAMSDCCDNEFCNSGAEDLDDCHSEPVTEPPKQLKLEQFLQQLMSLTTARSHPHKECPKRELEYRSLRHPDGASDQDISGHPWDSAKIEFTDFPPLPTPYSIINESVKSPTSGHTPRSLSATSPPQISSPNEPLFVTASPNHAVLPTSPRVNRLLGTTVNSSHSSPAKSSVSRKQQKLEQHLKRNTTSTTTSGHGTTSEGECSSVAKKTSSVSTPSCASHHPVVQRQPASSGYESTIHDDDSDRELVGARKLDIGSTINESVGGTPVKMRSKKSETNKDDKNRLSTSSDQCSFLCCKFMKFYQ